jgi:protein-tyrosine phosphatase
VYTDCHTHILPGIDDGAKSDDEGLQMARISAAAGTTRVFATPHGYTGQFHVKPGVTLRLAPRFNSLLRQAGIDVTVLPAMEVHHCVTAPTRVPVDVERLRTGAALCYGAAPATAEHRYLLLEFDFEQWPPDAGSVLRALREEGVQVVLAHPERYDAVVEDPSLIDVVLEQGAWLQLTTGSILGHFGHPARELARRLLEQGRAHIIASDAHNPHKRPPGLAEAFAVVRVDWGLAAAAEACLHNADRIWEAAVAYAP